MGYKYRGLGVFNYNDFFFFFPRSPPPPAPPAPNQDDRQESDAIESIVTDSDDCIVSSPVFKNIKQVSQSIYGNYLVSLRKIF